MFHLIVHRPGAGFELDIPPEKISNLLQQPETLTWLDLESPTPQEHQLLRDEFRFHPLAIEDTEHKHQRSKIERYADFYFLVVYVISYEDGTIQTYELDLFVGPNYLVTVHALPLPVLSEVAVRWQREAVSLGGGIPALLYTLLDAVVDDIFPVVDTLGDQIDDLEDQIFTAKESKVLQPIFQLKKDLLSLRRHIAPQRDVLNVLLRRELPFLDAQHAPYFQDVYDHVVRLTDNIDTYRDILASAMDAYLTVVSNRLNQVMKTLTAMATILMTLALVAGIYGMNFHNIPELSWPYGYYYSLGLMAALGLALSFYFWRKHWF
ncbi:MAG TPA: magnesium/cobalt transporter CorA [Armatimonadota bacterium]|nr:magnesium/cobalt transporter CorA [Armatimonadota bacterium]